MQSRKPSPSCSSKKKRLVINRGFPGIRLRQPSAFPSRTQGEKDQATEYNPVIQRITLIHRYLTLVTTDEPTKISLTRSGHFRSRNNNESFAQCQPFCSQRPQTALTRRNRTCIFSSDRDLFCRWGPIRLKRTHRVSKPPSSGRPSIGLELVVGRRHRSFTLP